MAKKFHCVLYETNDSLALVTINRPEKHNAISLQTLEELQASVDMAEKDESNRVIAITGAGGKAFASGSDLNEVAQRDLKKALEPIVQGLAAQLEAIPKPTIAAIDGICISSVSDLNDDSQLTYFDVYTLANQIIFGS